MEVSSPTSFDIAYRALTLDLGQGALYILTHHPDKVLGAALVSAYTSIQG